VKEKQFEKPKTSSHLGKEENFVKNETEEKKIEKIDIEKTIKEIEEEFPEDHEREQFYFEKESLKELLAIILDGGFKKIACLGVPTLALALEKLGREVTLLDIDERFKDVIKGYKKWDITKPQYIKETFDLIIVDPPFSKVRTGQIKRAIEMLAHYNPKQKILISYFTPRAEHFLKVFKSFNLEKTGFYPKYQNLPEIKKTKKGDERKQWVEFFSNFEIKKHKEQNTE